MALSPFLLHLLENGEIFGQDEYHCISEDLFIIIPTDNQNCVKGGLLKLPSNKLNKIQSNLLGFRKQPMERTFHRSRAGKQLFHHIHVLISDFHWKPSQIITTGKSLSSNLINVEPHEYCDRPIKGLVKLVHVNARSISNKILDFQEYISSKNVDVCVITEMWLKKDDVLTCKQIPPIGYKIHSIPRQDGHQRWRNCQ